MKKILNSLALIAMLFSATSFASCEKTGNPLVMDITSIQMLPNGLQAAINGKYLVDLDRDFTMQVDGYPGETVTNVPLLVTINGITFSTSGVANITPDDMGNIRKRTANGYTVSVKARFHAEIDGRVIVQITSVIIH